MIIVGGMYIVECEITRSWGIEPASASGKAVVGTEGSAGISVGDYYAFNMGGAIFYGIVSSATQTQDRVAGAEVLFEMVDNRVRLGWGIVFGQWNMPEDRDLIHSDDYARALTGSTPQGSTAPGVDFGAGVGSGQPVADVSQEGGSVSRGRLYGHIFPAHWGAQIKTYSTDPLSAIEILQYAFDGAVGGYQFGLSNHAAQSKPVFSVDANSGISLAALVSQMSDAQGLQVTLNGQHTLTWDRRGGLVIPPIGSYVSRDGFAISSEPTKVRVVGDRNLVQVCNLELEADWNSGWEEFMSEPAWLEEVKRVTPSVSANAAGRAELAARAREITVRQYIQSDGVSQDLADYGRWGKVSRMDIPAWVYINSIVFRSYRIPKDKYLMGLPLRSLEIHDRLLCAMELPGTGDEMRYRSSPVEFYPQSAAYVIAQGQPLDLISAADRTSLLNLRTKDMSTTWSEVSDFTVDALNHSIRFSCPVFLDGDAGDGKSIFLFANKGEGGFDDVTADAGANSDYLNVCVPNKDYKISAAKVKISLTFRLGKFYKDFGSGAKWTPLQASTLSEHLLHNSGGSISHSLLKTYTGDLHTPDAETGLKEICYDNGSSAEDLAEEQVDGFIVREGVEQSGSFTRVGAFGTSLTGGVNRITIKIDRSGGYQETVEYAKPRPTVGFVSSRDVAHRLKTEELFDGQEDLRREARQLRTIAGIERMSLNDKPRSGSHSQITDIAKRPLGAENPSCVTYPDPNSQYPEGHDGWRAGDLIWLNDESVPNRGGMVFGGVCVTSTDGGAKYVNAANAGTVPMAVKPGTPPGVSLRANPGDWFASEEGSYPLGMLNHSKPVPGEGDATLALVQIGAGGDTGLRFAFHGLVKNPENQWALKVGVGAVLYNEITADNIDNYDDRGPKPRFVNGIIPTIKVGSDYIRMDDETKPMLLLNGQPDGAVWLICQGEQCGSRYTEPDAERLELVRRGKKPKAKNGEICTLIAEFDVETTGSGASQAKKIKNVYRWLQGDHQQPYLCDEADDDSSIESEPDSDFSDESEESEGSDDSDDSIGDDSDSGSSDSDEEEEAGCDIFASAYWQTLPSVLPPKKKGSCEAGKFSFSIKMKFGRKIKPPEMLGTEQCAGWLFKCEVSFAKASPANYTNTSIHVWANDWEKIVHYVNEDLAACQFVTVSWEVRAYPAFSGPLAGTPSICCGQEWSGTTKVRGTTGGYQKLPYVQGCTCSSFAP